MWNRPSAGQKAKDVAYLLRYYWPRLLSTCGCWFFWDFGFYGNKIFQSEFIKILSPSAYPPPPRCVLFLSCVLLQASKQS